MFFIKLKKQKRKKFLVYSVKDAKKEVEKNLHKGPNK